MGAGTFTTKAYADYSTCAGKVYSLSTGRISGQEFHARSIDPSLDPRRFCLRECANSDEHPNTIPVILALDVTGSMGEACSEVAEALGVIINNLYEKFNDIEFCVMGIGDLSYDRAPIQMSQFESDVRIAEALDKIYMEHGGGGNMFESYTAAWYMGLYKTKLDAFTMQGRKGIIITMGDEPLNPYLPKDELNAALGTYDYGNSPTTQDGGANILETKNLYSEASKKFDIFHISVDSPNDCYQHYKKDVDSSFGQLLGNRYKISSINTLAQTIEDCITESVNASGTASNTLILEENNSNVKTNDNGDIVW